MIQSVFGGEIIFHFRFRILGVAGCIFKWRHHPVLLDLVSLMILCSVLKLTT